MSKGKSGVESNGDTQEFEAIRPPEPVVERTEFELVGNYRVQVKPEFQHPIELRLGRDERTPTFYLIQYPTHRLPIPTYALSQPEVIRTCPGRGWVEFGRPAVEMESLVQVGRGISPQFELGPDVSRRHCLVSSWGTSEVDGNTDVVEIENYGRNGLRVLMHPDDMEGVPHPFDPTDAWE